MRLIRCMVCGVAALCTMLATATAAEPLQVRVLSYNIHHAEGTDGKLDLPRIAKIITSAKPDLVALQEIDFKTDRTGGVDQAAELAKLTKLHVAPGDNIDYGGGRYGNAVLSRWPIIEHKNHKLPNDGGEQRGVLMVEVDPGDGMPRLQFLGTHLDHRPAEGERLASATFINQLAAEPNGPGILAGDLNAVPASETLKRFENAWMNPTAERQLPTIPSKTPARQIDYVLCRPSENWRMVEAKVLDEPVASDHRPLLVVLEWQPAD